ncbi:MAG: phosphoesterase, partial [Romboutsia timonensis]
MTSKKILKMNMPEVNLYIVTVGIASIFLLYYNFYIGVLFFIGFLYMVINNWKTTNIRRKEWTNYIQNLSLDIDETTKKAVMNLPIPLCILEFDGSITWYNGKFNTMIGEDDLLGVNIDDLIKNLNLRKVLNENKEMYTDISYKDREYTIVYNVIKNENGKSAKYLMMLYWIDKTDFLQMQKKYNEEKNAIMLIQVDGYDEVLKSADEENRPLLSVAIEKELTALEMNSNGALKRTSKDKFFLIMNKKELKKLETDKFSVLDQIRKIDYGNNLPVTISMGIGIDGDTINENLKLATGALDLALGRGGDQAVIKTKDKFAFYGGKSKAV